MRAILLIAVGLFLLAGCAGKVEPPYPPKELQDFEARVALERVWRERVGRGLGRAGYPIAPARDGDRVFAADAAGTLMALEAETGKTRWETDLGVPVSSALTAVSGRVYLGTRNGEVLAIDQDDGSIAWRTRVSSEVLAAPQTNRQLLVVQSVDGNVTALDRASGEERWVHGGTRPSLTLRGTGTPRVIDPVTFAGFANGRLTTLDNRSGEVLWELPIAIPRGSSEIDRLVDLAGQPVLTSDGRLFVTSYNGRLVALDATRGEFLWTREHSSYRTPVLIGNFLFSVDEASHVRAFDAEDGEPLWHNDDLEGRGLTSATFTDGRLVLGDAEGYLHLLDARSGELVGRTRVDGSGISVPPLTDGQRIIVLANDGTLEALEIRE